MTLFPIGSDDFEAFTIVTNPKRFYSSSSNGQPATGSVHVFARRSDTEKDLKTQPAFIDALHSDYDINASLRDLQKLGMKALHGGLDIPLKFKASVVSYMDKVSSQSVSVRKQKVLDVAMFTPSYTLTTATFKKMTIKNVLMPYHRVTTPTAHYAYTNYNCLNFYTASNVPTSSALLYPNVDGPDSQAHAGFVSGTYSLKDAFSFDFYIKPSRRGVAEAINATQKIGFKAGTLLHLSSSYAVSLVSGSSRDPLGRPDGFRIQLQLSHSADITPSRAVLGTYPSNLVFLSDDNSLLADRWHHVVVRWGTSTVNQGTGSFNVDGVDKGYFIVPSGTITPRLFSGGQRANPDVLCVGNYFEGNNTGINAQAYFFANDPATRDGLNQLIFDVGGIDEPSHYSFTHPLNAEVHDVAIKRYYMTNDDINASSSVAPTFIDTDRIAFYLPPFFVEESPFRQFVGLHGGIMQTPFFEVDGTTNDPFNVAMSFGVAGHYINLENFVRDFASNVFPRLHHLTGVAIDHTTAAESANVFLYRDPFVIKRNLTLLPCDDGNFTPGFGLISSESMQSNLVDDFGNPDNSFIHLDNMISTSSLLFGRNLEDGITEATSAQDFIEDAIGFTPEFPGRVPGPAFSHYVATLDELVASGTFEPGVQGGAPLTIFQRTRDPSSNQVTVFDISNLFYGNKIHPGTFVLVDKNLSGSDNMFGVTLKDDGKGNIYRADCVTSASTWNSVGNIFYDEGVVLIKSPHLFFFGQHQYEMSFRGEQNIHSLKVEVLAPAGLLNSSSNPSYTQLSASARLTDTDPDFVWISGINFLDENLNVVMKTQLAQPILKRFSSAILFKTTIDV